MIIKMNDFQKVIYGRHAFTEDGELLVSWNLSGFSVCFRGAGIGIYFGQSLPEGENVYIRAEIDGEPWGYTRTERNGVYRIDGLADAEHTLVFRRVGGSVATFEITAIEVDDGAEILPPPPMPPLRMEFVGDSITYGYGLLCERCDGFLADTDADGTGTYAYLTAKAFGADIRTEAISGQGIVCKYDGSRGKLIPEFFKYDDAELTLKHDFSSWIPDVVVINAGTNDCFASVTSEDFCRSVDKFLDRIREVYSDAQIFYAYGIMGDVYRAPLGKLIEKRAKTDKKLHFVPIEPISNDEIGPRSHPNCKAHERAAKVLIDAIREVVS